MTNRERSILKCCSQLHRMRMNAADLEESKRIGESADSVKRLLRLPTPAISVVIDMDAIYRNRKGTE